MPNLPDPHELYGLAWQLANPDASGLDLAIACFKRRFPTRKPKLLYISNKLLHKEYSLNGLIVKPIQACPKGMIMIW